MKTIILIFFICPFVAFAQIDASHLSGTWVLAHIDAKGTIRISKSTSHSDAINSATPVKTEYIDVPLQTYVEKDMKTGITTFVFTANSFEFYRARPLTFSGTYTIDHSTLVLLYGADKNGKRSKVTSLSADKLVLESESHGKPITLSFVRK